MKVYRINIAEVPDEKVVPQELEVLQGVCPITTLGQLRTICKDLPDDTVICSGIVPMYAEGSKIENPSVPRTHRVHMVWKGVLKNGRAFISFMAGEDVSKAVFKDGRLILKKP